MFIMRLSFLKGLSAKGANTDCRNYSQNMPKRFVYCLTCEVCSDLCPISVSAFNKQLYPQILFDPHIKRLKNHINKNSFHLHLLGHPL